MNDVTASFIRFRHIDSFQKLRFLLFLLEHPKLTGTISEFAELLYFGDVELLEEIIGDLQKAGLIECVEENRCKLHDEPDVRSCLEDLAKAFEDPLTRQEILDQVGHGAFFSHYQENAHGFH
jgi:hypothetical protein